MRKSNSKTFIKYMCGYLLMVIVPTIILSFIILHNNKDILENEIINTAETKGKLIQSSADNIIQAIINNSLNLLNNESINKDLYSSNVLSDMSIQDELKKDSSYDHTTHLQYFYSEEFNKLYSINNVINLENNHDISINGRGIREFTAGLKNHSGISFVEECSLNLYGNVKRCFAIVVFDGAAKTNRFVINFVDINALFKEVDKDKVFLFGKDNRLIAANKEKDFELYSEYMFDDAQSGKLTDGSQYYNFLVRSKVPGIYYRIYLDYNKTFKAIRQEQFVFIIGMLLIFILTVFLAPYMANLQYRPVKEIMNYIKFESINNNAFETDNEFLYIKNAIKRINSENKNLNAKVNSNMTAIREYLLLKLVYGEFESIAHFNKYARQYHMEFKSESVCIIGVSGSFDSELIQNVLDKFEKNEHISAILDPQMLVFFEEKGQNLNMRIKHIKDIISQISDNEIYISVSPYINDLKNMLNYFFEVKNSCAYSKFSKNNKIIFVDGNSYQDMIESYDTEILDRLVASIEKCNEEEIEENIERLRKIMLKHINSEHTVKCMMYQIVIRILKERKRLTNTMPDLEADTNLYNNILHSKSVDEFFDIIRIVCMRIANYIVVDKVQSEALINMIVKKIDMDFYKPDFSLNSIAEHFNMSPVNFSRYFKQTMGCNLKDYTAGLEIARAKELLIMSDMSVSEIANAVGQMDASNFIKKFKKYTGFTPGEYRESNRKED
ncbi:MAG: helix-turn-helix transcriptional regulator [Clostridia bacterium]|nr:helix-turn-helix transcriptional regulator [Clostridia bacterium]